MQIYGCRSTNITEATVLRQLLSAKTEKMMGFLISRHHYHNGSGAWRLVHFDLAFNWNSRI